jgi:hypothetical protein
VDLGVAVFASLGGGHFHDLARTVLDDDEAVLSQRRALHRVGGRGASIGALKGVLMLRQKSVSVAATCPGDRPVGGELRWDSRSCGVKNQAQAYLRVVCHCNTENW